MTSTLAQLGGLQARSASLPTGEQRRTTAQEDFSAILSKATKTRGDPQAQAREAAEQFVAVALIQPILKQMRSSNNTPAPFGPGEGEKAFSGIADAALAQNLVRSKNFPLVGAIADQLLKRGMRLEEPSPEPAAAPTDAAAPRTEAKP